MSGTPRKRLVGILTGLFEILESRMLFHLLNCDRPDLLGDQAGEPSWMPIRRVPIHSRRSPSVAASTRLARSGSSRLCRANVGTKSPGDQGDHVHSRSRPLAAFCREVGDFVQPQHIAGIAGTQILLRIFNCFLMLVQSGKASMAHTSGLGDDPRNRENGWYSRQRNPHFHFTIRRESTYLLASIAKDSSPDTPSFLVRKDSAKMTYAERRS